jgi:hypothetical protein
MASPVAGGVDERLQPRDHAGAVVARHPRQHLLQAAHLDPVELLHQGAALPGELQHVDTAVAGMIAAQHELLLLQPVDDVGHRGQGDAEGLGHVPHVAAGVLPDVEEHLRLGVGQVQLRGALPQELAKRGAAQGVQQVEQPLGLRRPGARGGSNHALMIHPLNSCVNKESAGIPWRGVNAPEERIHRN